jgi:UDP-GlcNAc:undecaprenyl-phosphate GlcNAc-1-phosphate transferase
VLALLALALRFVPYSDDRGNFDPIWTALMVVVIVAAIAVSVYLVIVLEIVKLKRSQNTQP